MGQTIQTRRNGVHNLEDYAPRRRSVEIVMGVVGVPKIHPEYRTPFEFCHLLGGSRKRSRRSIRFGTNTGQIANTSRDRRRVQCANRLISEAPNAQPTRTADNPLSAVTAWCAICSELLCQDGESSNDCQIIRQMFRR